MTEGERKILNDILMTVQRIEVSANAYHFSDVVWDEPISAHYTSGSAGEALIRIGSIWDEPVSLHNMPGTVGEMLSRIDGLMPTTLDQPVTSIPGDAEYHLKEAMAKVDPANASIIAVAMDQLREVGEIK